MKESSPDTQIDFHGENVVPSSSSIGKWRSMKDTSILIADPSQVISHQKIIRKWNQLSRLQRSLVYAFFAVTATVLVLFYSAKVSAPAGVNSPNNSNIVLEPLKNISLVNERLVNAPRETGEDEFMTLNGPLRFTGPTNERQYAVVQSFKHAWKGYKDRAWGHDNVKPVSGMPFDWFSLGLTIVDGLDTAYIMGLTEEFEEGRQWIADELVFTHNKDVNLFEVTIRVLGALLSNYHLSRDDMFLHKAKDLGSRLAVAFSTPSRIPYSDVNLGLQTAHAPDWSHYSTTAEVSTLQLEFKELSKASGDPKYEDLVGVVSEKIHNLRKTRGLVPIFINPSTGLFLPRATLTLGARGDSYYEYLLKQWLQSGKSNNVFLEDYLEAMEGVRAKLAKRSSPNKYLFIGELSAGSAGLLNKLMTGLLQVFGIIRHKIFIPKMDHLTCFLPGTLALGHSKGLPDWHMTMAEELIYTCYLMYAAHPTFLAPEITHFNLDSTTDDMYTKTADAHSLLRPEFVESLWYLYQITGNTTYQDWGWKVYQGFEKYAKVRYGYSSLASVKTEKPVHRDMMESFFLAETLKYLYLLFSDDRYLINLDHYVMNSEAHPLPIYDH